MIKVIFVDEAFLSHIRMYYKFILCAYNKYDVGTVYSTYIESNTLGLVAFF